MIKDDLVKVYNNIECKSKDDCYCISCSCCVNKVMCDLVSKLIKEIEIIEWKKRNKK